ncbi:unnamed protein product [Caenorhabditis bovis]|uniref:Uncharacterized protein n=1 Tax=Caenorhabditis bovis TaxID=2654633 RepID=A0A8S1F416_9PELO|nr:unnamed protein product [Caenorhabditis bovis]
MVSVYFLVIFVQQLSYVACFIIMFQRILTYKEGCDIAIAKIPYIAAHIPLAASLTMGVFSQNFVLPLTFFGWAYQNCDLNKRVINAATSPDGIENRLSKILIVIFTMLIASLLMMIYTRKLNHHHRDRIESNLSARFQLQENLSMQGFIARILIVNLIFNLMHSGSGYALSFTNIQWSAMNAQFMEFVRNALNLSPLNGLIVSFIAIRQVAMEQRHRIQATTRIVGLPVKGHEGYEAYRQILNVHWTQHSKATI